MRKFKLKIASKVVYGFKRSISHFCTVPKWMHTLDEFIRDNQLINSGDKLLLAVSGGMDSMLLLWYLHHKNYTLEVAHCNFGLRGMESDADETLVEKYCHEQSIPFHVKKFDTANYGLTNGLSIQMAARDLRYTWFYELNDLHFNGKAKIVTAHHKSDHVETLLINMLRGTGLKGMEGIAPISGHLIRPLLCFSKIEIQEAIALTKINYREDQSNASDKYQRNRLRHNVIPEFKKINPDFENTLVTNSHIVRQANGFIEAYISTIEIETVSVVNHQTHIDINVLKTKPEPKFILFTLLSKFGFNSATVDDIYGAIQGISGKQFYSKSHKLLIDRGRLIIEKNEDLEPLVIEIYEDTTHVQTDHHQWIFKKQSKEWSLPISNQEALVDFDALQFPLILRLWQHGDSLRPLGMKGHKKVSDILIDKKVTVLDKNKVWVLVSDMEIIWISGLMLSEDFKICDKTKTVLSISISPSIKTRIQG